MPEQAQDLIDPAAEQDIQAHRLAQIRRRLADAGCEAIVLFDPVNIRYATGTRNMQVWTMHNICRYAVVFADAAPVLFELPSSAHLARGYVDDIRPALTTDFMAVGGRTQEMGRRWAQSMLSLLAEQGLASGRLAIDRADLVLVQQAERCRLQLVEGQAIMERARAIKSPLEVDALRRSLATCEQSVAAMRDRLEPGMRESDALAMLIDGSIQRGGEYPETRLLTTGPRTNPWFQETSQRVIENGDLLAFDTDMIGPLGFYNDISRSWVVGDRRPDDRQRRLYELAYAQMTHNTELLRVGIGFLEYSDRAYQLPDDCLPNRYADVAHGCGMGVEYPFIWYREDEEWGAYDGVFEENMVVCIECYVGELGGHEGVKLEQPVWLSADGPVVLSDYPFELDYL
ncbi:MAG: Xaa-Pro peptidase family protein [Gammaproteobacteria bacterium]|nr:Xaa-Pro peptidase family protein [Gammaproteobacteria bacterium]